MSNKIKSLGETVEELRSKDAHPQEAVDAIFVSFADVDLFNITFYWPLYIIKIEISA